MAAVSFTESLKAARLSPEETNQLDAHAIEANRSQSILAEAQGREPLGCDIDIGTADWALVPGFGVVIRKTLQE